MTQIEKYRSRTRKCNDVILRDTLNQTVRPIPGQIAIESRRSRESSLARFDFCLQSLRTNRRLAELIVEAYGDRSAYEKYAAILRYVNGRARHGGLEVGEGEIVDLQGRKAKCQTHFHRDGARRIRSRYLRSYSRAKLSIYIARFGERMLDLRYTARDPIPLPLRNCSSRRD
jgi:hypothetical protein